MTPERFKVLANKSCEHHLGFECFEPGDPYDLEEVLKDALKAKQTPAAFVREQFDEDFARKAYDRSFR